MALSRSFAVGVGTCLVMALSGPAADMQAQEPSQIEVWTPLPAKPNPFVPPHKAWTKLPDVLAKHKGQANWSELIVDDNLFHGEYISMAPGAKTPRRFHQDNRAFWIVQDGQIRFTIEGQEPFVATKGFLVQVPKRLVYSMETVGDRPSLRFEVLMANSQTMYPADETPPPTPGIRFEKTRVANSKGSYDEANVPYIDYNLTIAGTQKPKKNPTQFIGDAHDGNYVNVGIANILRGDPKTQKPAVPGDKGHLHVTGPLVRDRSYVLVDDVVATGAHLAAAQAVLRAHAPRWWWLLDCSVSDHCDCSPGANARSYSRMVTGSHDV